LPELPAAATVQAGAHVGDELRLQRVLAPVRVSSEVVRVEVDNNGVYVADHVATTERVVVG
jgi:hypothetical protein